MDTRLIGRRVKLVHTSFTCADIEAGDQGTVVYSRTWDSDAIPVRWDNGVLEPLIIGEDAFQILTEETS